MASKPVVPILVSQQPGTVTLATPPEDRRLRPAMLATAGYVVVRILVTGIGGGLLIAWLSAIVQVVIFQVAE